MDYTGRNLEGGNSLWLQRKNSHPILDMFKDQNKKHNARQYKTNKQTIFHTLKAVVNRWIQRSDLYVGGLYASTVCVIWGVAKVGGRNGGGLVSPGLVPGPVRYSDKVDIRGGGMMEYGGGACQWSKAGGSWLWKALWVRRRILKWMCRARGQGASGGWGGGGGKQHSGEFWMFWGWFV